MGMIAGWTGGQVLTALTSPANDGPAPGVVVGPLVDFLTRNVNRAIVIGAISMSGQAISGIGGQTTCEICTTRPWNLPTHQMCPGPFGFSVVLSF